MNVAQVNGNIYMTQQTSGDVVQINNNGTFNQTILTGLPSATGIIAGFGPGITMELALGSWVIDPADAALAPAAGKDRVAHGVR